MKQLHVWENAEGFINASLIWIHTEEASQSLNTTHSIQLNQSSILLALFLRFMCGLKIAFV